MFFFHKDSSTKNDVIHVGNDMRMIKDDRISLQKNSLTLTQLYHKWILML